MFCDVESVDRDYFIGNPEAQNREETERNTLLLLVLFVDCVDSRNNEDPPPADLAGQSQQISGVAHSPSTAAGSGEQPAATFQPEDFVFMSSS